MTRNLSLDAFRGILAIAVALGHFFYWTGHQDRYPVSFVFAVDFFFVLSGFVLTASILNDKKTGDAWFVSFFERRILRIFPVYLACALAGIILTRFVSDIDPQINLLRSIQLLFLGQMTGFSDGGNFLEYSSAGVAWSISAEMWVGLLFFPVVFLLRGHRFVMFALSVFVALFCSIIMKRYAPHGMDTTYAQLTPFVTGGSVRCLLGFCFGYMAHYAVTNYRLKLNFTAAQIAICAAIVAVFFRVKFNISHGLLSPMFSAALIYCFSFRGFLSQRMSGHISEWTGRLSYSIYMVHPCILCIFMKYGVDPSALSISVYLLMIAVLSLFLHVFIENPCINAFKRRRSALIE